MAHNPHAHLQREIDSLRKQLIQERDTRRYDEALHVTSVIKQAPLTPVGVQAQAMVALAPEGKSNA